MKTSQAIGLPVISISDGNEIGKVKNVMINASKGAVDFFVIGSNIHTLEGGIIPVSAVQGIGEYAMTILEEKAVSDIVRIPAAVELLQKNITVVGSKVLTRKGKMCGEAGEIHFDEDNSCVIIGVEFISKVSTMKSGIIPRNKIMTFSKNLLVVTDDFADNLIEMTDDLILTEDLKKNEILSYSNPYESYSASVYAPEPTVSVYDAPATETMRYTYPEPIVDTAEIPAEPLVEIPVLPFYEETSPTLEVAPVAEEPEISLDGLVENLGSDSAFKLVQPVEEEMKEEETSGPVLFSERQRQFSRGRLVTRIITDSSGTVLANAGDTITDEMINRIRHAGRLVELVMNNEP